MSKTVGSILVVAGAVAVNVIPGAGQAISAFLLGSVGLSVGTAVAVSGAITSGLTVAGITSALGAAQSLLYRSPKPEQTVSAIRVPSPPRLSAYGRVRLFWAWILYETASDGWAVDVGVFHDGRLDAIETHYIGDAKVTVLAGGWIKKGPAGEWGNNDSVRIGTRVGLPTETAFAEVMAKLPGIWTVNHRGDGCATGFMLSKNVKAENFQEVYSAGGPNQATLSIVARAQRVYDWRDPSQVLGNPDTWKWSENVWLHIAHYELVRVGRRQALPPSDPGYAAELAELLATRWARKIAPALAYWTAAANDADTAMALKGGGTEPRYRSCVAHKHTDAHKEVRANLLGCCDGWMAPRADGALVVYSGRYYEPTVTIGPDEILSYSLQEGVDEESAVNTIKPTYVSAAHDFSTVDTDDWTDESDIAARGKQLSTPLENQVPSHSQARRLTKREMARIMAPQRGSTTTNAAGRKALGQRYVRQQIVEAGTTFQFAVVEVIKLRRNPQTGGLTYDWVLADPNVDGWNPATEEGDPAPTGDRVAREPLAAPTIVSITPTYGQNTAYGVPGVKLTIIAQGPDRSDLIWYVRTRAVGGVSWLEQRYPDVDPGASVTLQTDFLPLDEIEAEAAYSTGDGRISPWGLFEDGAVDTGNVLPLEVTGLSVSTNADQTLIVADWNDSQFATSYLVEVVVE